ncbi:MAG: aminotransferase class V-fold PLP-dependent enzyme [Pseudomonadota bacterium]|nr:aminotransferase class V-fold PLP-dependent enzyme [Pseudomonadota bacterium]
MSPSSEQNLFADLASDFAGPNGWDAARSGLIGKGATFDVKGDVRALIYADYVASGRAVAQIEDVIRDRVLPFYANSHSEDSYCGAFITAQRTAARAEIGRICGAGRDHAVIFTGSGSTSALNRLVHLLGVRDAVAQGRPATVLIGPYEHHSNILPWRESGARVIEIQEFDGGGPDLNHLKAVLAQTEGLVVGAFSAASNVTGILTDVAAVTRVLKAAGARAVWDYAAAAPYVQIDMEPAPGIFIDAVATSPHKFVGGPAASGVLILRKDSVTATTPTLPGGGSVLYVSASAHDYLDDVVEREEAGTPNVIGDIRAAMAFALKDALGTPRIEARNRELVARALSEWRGVPGLHLLGKTDCPRLPIFSFLVTDREGRAYDPGFVTRLLSDRFGIQARGGCACAGPYGHRLLDIDARRSAAIRTRILDGDSSAKPGFVRLNFSYLIDDAEAHTIIDAVAGLPALLNAELRDAV